MPEKWISLDGKETIEVEPDRTDAQGNVTHYRVWPVGCPEPPGNPVKWKPETLRIFYRPEREGKR